VKAYGKWCTPLHQTTKNLILLTLTFDRAVPPTIVAIRKETIEARKVCLHRRLKLNLPIHHKHNIPSGQINPRTRGVKTAKDETRSAFAVERLHGLEALISVHASVNAGVFNAFGIEDLGNNV